MRTRTIAVIAACCIASTPAGAQTAPIAAHTRIRITGPDAFERPGLIRIDGDRVTATGSVTGDDTVLRFATPGGTELTVVRSGKRLVGDALGIENGLVSVRADGTRQVVRIPLDALGSLEVSESRGRRHLVRGVLVGAGVFWGTGALIFSSCGLGCSNASILPAIGAGIAAGWLISRAHERWTPRPAGWLASQFTAAAAPSMRPSGLEPLPSR